MAGLTRKTVTVLFSDIVDSTPLGESLDPEPVRALMARYFERMSAVIERHGGTVEKYIGDAIMAVFGIPAVHEDDALRAVRAATEMRDALADLNAELAHPLSIRIGLNTGEVVAGEGHTLVTGDAVNVAARLEQAADAGEILIGAATHALVRDAVVSDPLEPLSLKGKSWPVPAWRVTAVLGDVPGRARRLDAALVGRDREVQLLAQALARVTGTRSSHLFTILGPAGVGKSRLANEFLASARDEHATVVTGRCLPYGDGVTFWPLRDVIDAVGDVEALIGKRDADVIAGTIGTVEAPAPTADTFRAVRRLIEALAQDGPVILMFEDVHWAEPTFLELVEHLAERLRDAPVLILCLARPELYEERPSWAGGKLNATTILLESLDADESERLIDALGGGDIDQEMRRTISETAEGIPLFLEEMVAMLSEDPGASTVPPTIHALLTARLERLGDRERSVLAAASVVGRFFSRDAVVALAGDIDGGLDTLEHKDLIRAQRVPFAAGEGYRFRHILIRDAAYDSLSKAARAEMHERLARWFEQTSTDVDELLGWHFEQAARYRNELGSPAPGLAQRAADLLRAAGLRAHKRGDALAAVSLLSRATAILPRELESAPELLSELGSALLRAGRYAEADDVLSRAAEQAGPPVRQRALLDREFARSYLHPERGSQSLVAVAAEVIPELERLGDDVGLAKAWWLRSEADSIACRWGKRAEALERALAYARRARAGDDAATYVGLLAQALYYGPTPVDRAFERCTTLLEETEGNRALEASLESTLAGLHAMRGEFDEARRLWSRAAAVYDELGLRSRRANRSLVGGEIEALAGNYAAAEHELRVGHDTLEAMGERAVRSTLAAFLARTLAAQGRLSEADDYARFSEETAGPDDLVTQSIWRATRAEVLAAADASTEAEATARAAVRIADETDFLDLQAHARLSLAAVLRTAGRTREADTTLAEAVARFGRKGNSVAAERAAAASSQASLN